MILFYSKSVVSSEQLLIIFSRRGRKLSAVIPTLLMLHCKALPARIALIEGGDFRVTVNLLYKTDTNADITGY
jgi:hypothetical protein